MAVAGIVLLACLPLALGYLTFGHDLSAHLSRIEGLKAGLLSGQFPVRINPDLLEGRGYAFSLMYADLLLYPAAVLRILGFPLYSVYQLYVGPSRWQPRLSPGMCCGGCSAVKGWLCLARLFTHFRSIG